VSNYFTFTIADNFNELSALCQQIHRLLEERNISPKQIYAVMLTLEEMITNTIKYGYDDDGEHQITVKITLDTDIKLLIEDNGHEFDPLQNKPESLSAGIEERQVGGMGIHLTKNMVKSISYCRSNEMNILTVTI
jgi:serine/threonine-protein kinase RsbW